MADSAADDTNAPYAVLNVISTRPSGDGTHVILELQTLADDLPLAIPVGILPPMVALLGQASGLAHAIAGSVPHQQILETCGTEVFRDEDNLDIHFRLIGGLDLPIGLTLQGAAELCKQLTASLAGATSLPPGTTRQ